jgi:hypothetical protein
MRPAEFVPAPAITARETFSVGSAIGRSISVWGRNLPFFLALSIAVYLPLPFMKPQSLSTPGAFVLPLVGFLLTVVLSYVATGFMTYSVLEQLRGRSPSPAASLRYGASRLGPLLIASIFTGVMIFGAALLFAIPGLILAVRWALVAPVVIAEKGVDPRARSAELTAGHRWGVFGLLLLLGLAGLLLVSVLGLAFGQSPGLVAQLVGNLIPQALVLSFSAVVYGVIYYLLRSEKEGVDIEQLTSVFR